MKKFLKFIFILLIPVLFATNFYFVKADDDNETEERNEEGDEEDDEDYKPQTTTKTIITQPSVSTKVETTTKTTIHKDSDGDGILDETDPHPAISEIYIVEDNNKNGIVDKFE
ncbi:MAG: hypothetical protein US30_C0004G0061 [Candidatus Moranbacteria bacterium GW2011_GWF2_36_839]|nr:MAG: hypothetical protein US27_C0002G0064 [Candidatus Moranbacteria bacterium GW2011_GWF1_36_78]KKQ17317.1 MAG: hypothetical protein US30_C0004G0061 [Candidatus Moranbacteria bacterium GW2011_GWF2_36_839]HAT73838.1 hypothetical protein [Candidatus Moranbacteria bacterium]HBY11019.1 hypothetical protein [Candidatus Moranbacteria bacterium]